MSTDLLLTFPHALGVPGGGPLHCRELALELRSAGAEVTVLSVSAHTLSNFPRPRPSSEMLEGALLRPLEEAGIEIRRVPQSPVSWWIDGLAVRRHLAELLSRRHFDAVLGWFGEVAFSHRLLARQGVLFGLLAAAPYSLWWKRVRPRPRWLHRLMEELTVARTARQADVVFANSVFTGGELVSLFGVDGSRIEIVHPPVSGGFAELRPDMSGSVERLLYTGRLSKEKGIMDLIEALGHLTNESWVLRVAGSGNTGPVLRAAQDCGIADRVTLLGHLDNRELAAELEWAQLVVLPSWHESFGLSVAEAQLAGLPVIGYDVGSLSEITTPHETAWLVEKRDTAQLAAAIADALKHPEETRRRSTLARRRARELFLGRTSGEKIVEIIRERQNGLTAQASEPGAGAAS